jgi:hypothetical protein
MIRISRLPRGNPAGCALVALASLIAGYLDLWRGGTSVAATLLTLGYLVFVPFAIRSWYLARAEREPAARGPDLPLRNGRSRASDAEARIATDDAMPPYGVAAAVALAVMILYVVTLAPSTAMWDTSEYIAVARVLGLPHPPGNPVFVLLAHTFALLPIPVSYAARVNLLAAATSAISAWLWFLVTHRALRGSGLPGSARIVAAVCAALIGATAFSVWNQSVVNEKVYTVAMLGVAIVAWLALRWLDAPISSSKADMLLVTIAYVCGIGYANHPAGFLPLPAVAVLLLFRRASTLLRWRVLLAAAAALVFGLTPFAFEPIRAAHNPAINEGEPTACVNGPKLSCTFSELTWRRLKANILREQYGGHAVAERQAPLSAQGGMWWLYFQWQWWRDGHRSQAEVQRALAVAFLLLAALGAAAHWRRDRDSFLFIAPLILTLSPALIFYLNFKYGWSQSTALGDSVPREVRDRDYFYVWSFASLAIWIGIGLATIWRWIAESLEREPSDVATSPARPWIRSAYVLSAPVLLVALIPFAGNVRYAPRSDHRFTAEWARDLLGSVEPYSILITNGDNDSFPLWYAQQVEGVRRDVSVVLLPYLGTDWYVRQLLRTRVDEYDGKGIPAYAALSVQRPTSSPLSLTSDEADSIPPYVQYREPQEFRHGQIRATVPPGVLTRDQLVVLRLIADSFPSRPVYFSLGNYPQSLGLGEHVVTQGLAQRLVDMPARSFPGVVATPSGYVDVPRSHALWDSYRAPTALLAERDWVDDASVMIPSAYVGTGQTLAQALAARGDSVGATSVFSATMTLARKLRLIGGSSQ